MNKALRYEPGRIKGHTFLSSIWSPSAVLRRVGTDPSWRVSRENYTLQLCGTPGDVTEAKQKITIPVYKQRLLFVFQNPIKFFLEKQNMKCVTLKFGDLIFSHEPIRGGVLKATGSEKPISSRADSCVCTLKQINAF